jgi:tetratricopeptide (TPR) repeat protein
VLKSGEISEGQVTMTLGRIWLVIFLALNVAVTACGQDATAPSNAGGADARALQNDAGMNDARYSSVNRLLAQGKYSEAISELEKLQRENPALAGLAHELGVAYYRKGDYFNAVKNFEDAQKENPKDQEAIQMTGLSLYLAGKPGEAIPYLERVQRWYPEANVDASYILGVAYIQTKKYPEARASFGRMFGVGADSAAAYLFCARMLLRLDFGPIAEDYGRKAASLDPKMPMAHFLLGELYLYQSKIPEAIAELQQEMAINPGYAAVYYKLGDAYSRLQKFDEAEKLLQRSIWLDATSTGPFILMGKVLEKKGETELAVRALEKAISMEPNNAIPHHLLGQAYRELGRAEDADRELKLAEQLQMKDTTAVRPP